eukprot:4134825-Amphidinium_carterae.2
MKPRDKCLQTECSLKWFIRYPGYEQTALGEMQHAGMLACGRRGVDALGSDGILGPSVSSLSHAQLEKKKSKRSLDTEEDADDDEHKTEEKKDGDDQTAHASKVSKAWDAETKTLKAEKEFMLGVETLRGALQATMADMAETLTEFRQLPQSKDREQKKKTSHLDVSMAEGTISVCDKQCSDSNADEYS